MATFPKSRPRGDALKEPVAGTVRQLRELHNAQPTDGGLQPGEGHFSV